MKTRFLCSTLLGLSLFCTVTPSQAEPAVAEAKPEVKKEAAEHSPSHYKSGVKVDVLLQSSKTVDDQSFAYPKGAPELRVLLVEIPPGVETGWHIHPSPCTGYILSGELSVEIKGKGSKTYRKGDAIVETINTLHNGTNKGTVPARLVMTIVGEQGTPTTVRAK